jgi:hypothetical protein
VDKSSQGHPSGVSHSRGHTRRHQFQPGIITEPLGSLTVILTVIPQATTEPNKTALTSNAANLTWLDPTEP